MGSCCCRATSGETFWGRESACSNNSGETSPKCLWCYLSFDVFSLWGVLAGQHGTLDFYYYFYIYEMSI